MAFRNSYEGLDEYAVRLIRCRARQLVGTAGFTESDRDDLEQELALDLLVRIRQFDELRARREVFISRVVRNRVATLIESRLTAKRGGCLRHASLHQEIDDGAGRRVELGRTLDTADAIRRTGAMPDDDLGRRIDVLHAVARLPKPLRLLAIGLMVGTPSDVSRATGVPRNTIHDAMRRIRVQLARLGVYLPRPVVSRAAPVRNEGDGYAAALGRSL